MTVTHTRNHVSDLQPGRGLLVAGAWRDTARTFEVFDPSTAVPVAAVSDATTADALAAVDAAHSAGPAWRTTAPRDRADILHNAFTLMQRDADRLAALITLENGKPEMDARAEVAYAAEFFRWFSEEAVRSAGAYGESPAGGARTVITHQPVGVAALVTPWNFPAAMVTRKVAPALAAGCTVVVKPAAETPLTAMAVAALLLEAGVPAGVVNLVPTSDAPGVVSTWLEDPRVRKISFTGSTQVGRALLRQAADRVVSSSMELGGNAPFIVTEDADLDAAVRGALVAKFRNGGQACTAANRFYVHEAVAQEFTARFGVAVEALRVGPGNQSGVQIGPVISAGAATRIENAVEGALAAGARVAHYAKVPIHLTGYFVTPVVLADVPPDAAIVQEEIFGPVAPIVPVGSDEEAVQLANDSEYGLAAYVYAGNLQRALAIGEAVDAGMVGINRGVVSDPSAPFGGVKQSGLGREGAREGLLAYTEPKYLSVGWPGPA